MTRYGYLLASTAPATLRAYASAPPVPEAVGYQPTPEQVAQAMAKRNGNTSVDSDEILKRSADSAAMLDYWTLTDTLIDGTDAVRAARTRFLPKFVNEPDKRYDFRLQMTKFTNIYRDIVESLAAKPFEQEVSVLQDGEKPLPGPIEQFVEDVDGSGNNITVFAAASMFNAINSAIDWIYVDYPKADPRIRTVADAQSAGIRPYWSRVLARNVLDPKSKIINGKETLTYIKIFEPGNGGPDHIREFERSDAGVVTWKLWVKTEAMHEGKTRFVVEDEGDISIGVIPLVPFFVGRRDGRSFRVFPAMRDAADLQVQLYQDESGLKFAKVLTAYPMLSGNGVKPDRDANNNVKDLQVGPATVLYAPTDGNGNTGSWSYVEPAASSLTFLAADIKETIQQLRELGRQPLTAQSGNLTVITAATAAGKARSAVAAWALGLKDALENALVITCMWFNIRDTEYSPQVNVYTEFDQFTEGKDLEDLQAMREAGDLSQETLWLEKKRRGVLSPEFDMEAERKRLLDETPADNEEEPEA